MKVFNPATEELIRELSEDSAESLRKKESVLRRGCSTQGLESWRQVPLEERIQRLARFSEKLEKNKKELARILTNEMGKPIRESLNEIAGARSRIQFFLDHSAEILKSRVVHEEPGMTESLEFEPLGVIANISAWNYPYLVGVNVFVPALIAGNAVLYKPSEYATLTGLEIARLLWESGVPESAFQIVVGGAPVGQALLDLPLDGYFFTGSYRTGRFIAGEVASKMVPFGLELGGKDPLYVAEDVTDLAKVTAAAVEGVFYNNGQSCCAVERIYVHQKIYDRFLENFLKGVGRLKVGNPLEPETTQGPLARPAHLQFLEKQVREAVGQGAKVLTGGRRWGKKGGFFEPTVLTEVNHKMSLMKEETFGPVIGIQRVSGDEEAVQLMNDTEYGLTASVYSGSEERAKKILRQINAGTGYWNCCDRVSPYLPWSGRKNSGIGSTLSFLGIQAFVKPKAYHLRLL
ncbi:MAG: aldehyde dehydrogenase family protein [Deltaproteobacteria bacterium]|nr:aldehyde dehydrogenase family protein [Deltaproteobacteria bacterium]